MSILTQSVHFRTQPKAMRAIEPRLPKQWDVVGGRGTGKRQGERIKRQIAKGMLSVGSKGFRAPLTYKQVGIE